MAVQRVSSPLLSTPILGLFQQLMRFMRCLQTENTNSIKPKLTIQDVAERANGRCWAQYWWWCWCAVGGSAWHRT